MEDRGTHAVGVLPIGALGVALYHYLTDGSMRIDDSVVFLNRSGGGGTERWSSTTKLAVETTDGRVDLPLRKIFVGDLLSAVARPRLPEIVLVCTNPDQLFEVLADYIAVVEHEHRAGRLLEDVAALPLLVLCANGIYFQRVRSSFIELLEESTLLGRLPDLWPDVMPQVVGRLMRGVTIQTSIRRGSGSDAVYRPGPPGRTLLTGGDRAARAAAAARLSALGGWFEDAGSTPPTRVEFDKALVNLSSNAIGQLAAIDDAGRFRVMTVGEIVTTERRPEIRELVDAVVRVGRAVGAYRATESTDEVLENTLQLLAPAVAHVPSSIQWIEQQLAAGALRPGLTPTEHWLLKPLQHYARSVGESTDVAYFEKLETDLASAIARAIKNRGRRP
jgi:hypothetical protein